MDLINLKPNKLKETWLKYIKNKSPEQRGILPTFSQNKISSQSKTSTTRTSSSSSSEPPPPPPNDELTRLINLAMDRIRSGYESYNENKNIDHRTQNDETS